MSSQSRPIAQLINNLKKNSLRLIELLSNLMNEANKYIVYTNNSHVLSEFYADIYYVSVFLYKETWVFLFNLYVVAAFFLQCICWFNL